MKKLRSIVHLPELEVDEEGKIKLEIVIERIQYIDYLRDKLIDMLGKGCNFELGENFLTTFAFECSEAKMEKVNEWFNIEFNK